MADNNTAKGDNQLANNKKTSQTRQSYAPAKGSLRMKNNNSMATRTGLNNTGFSNFKEPQLPVMNHASNGNNFGNLAPFNSTQISKTNNLSNLSSNHINSDFGNLKSGATQAGQQSAASRRRSNVVKEVDRIKKQREERRYRQAEQKAEKCELMSSVEPGRWMRLCSN